MTKKADDRPLFWDPKNWRIITTDLWCLIFGHKWYKTGKNIQRCKRCKEELLLVYLKPVKLEPGESIKIGIKLREIKLK